MLAVPISLVVRRLVESDDRVDPLHSGPAPTFSLQSLDGEQKEAAEMDGAGFVSRFIYLTLPHMARAITVVILIQTIFLLAVYAEILVTTNGGPGYASTNLPFLVYQKALLEFKIGQASAGGIIAVILANIVAFFVMRAVGKNLDK